jgi:hypothetical protein
VLAGLVALAIGVIGAHPTLLGVGVVLAGLGGLEVSVRRCSPAPSSSSSPAGSSTSPA